MQKISMAMPIWEHARCNWIVQPQHLMFLFPAFKNTHFHSTIPSWQVLQSNRRLTGSKINRNLAHSICVFFTGYIETHSYLVSCVYVIYKMESYTVLGSKDPSLKDSDLPIESLKSCYGLSLALPNQWILLRKTRSPWSFANLFITWNMCCMSLCIFRFG